MWKPKGCGVCGTDASRQVYAAGEGRHGSSNATCHGGAVGVEEQCEVGLGERLEWKSSVKWCCKAYGVLLKREG